MRMAECTAHTGCGISVETTELRSLFLYNTYNNVYRVNRKSNIKNEKYFGS